MAQQLISDVVPTLFQRWPNGGLDANVGLTVGQRRSNSGQTTYFRCYVNVGPMVDANIGFMVGHRRTNSGPTTYFTSCCVNIGPGNPWDVVSTLARGTLGDD